jgi:hypothetical protein
MHRENPHTECDNISTLSSTESHYRTEEPRKLLLLLLLLKLTRIYFCL